HARTGRHPKLPGPPGGHLVDRHPEKTALDLAKRDQVLYDAFHEAYGHGKPVPLIRSAFRRDGRADPHQLTVQVDECAAGVARIDCGVRLNEVLDPEAVFDDVDLTAERADDAGRHRRREPKRVA